ncbi:MAG TPA: MarR family transcriptional regulator [Candidatus Dormibacteraeota bacterium]|nr:MarR family transcriptional regulator [Candidatus Dormibacteraeota bacterium]
MRPNPDDPIVADVRAILHAFGRQRAVFADDTARFFMDVELTMAQFRALVAMRRWGRQTGRELARRLGVTPGTLVPMIDRLEELGYVRRVPDQDDRRQTWLVLTPQAERLFERMGAMGAAKIAAAIAQLVPSDRAELSRLLNQVADRMEANAGGPVQRRSPA